jgi:hypothetical protein
MAIDDYDILGFDPVRGSMDVYFRTVDFKWAINVPTDDTAKDPVALDGYIRGFFPYDMHQRKHSPMDPEAVELISSLVRQPTEEEIMTAQMQPTIGNVYHLLRQSDWTQLLDSGLDEDEVEAWAEYRYQLRTLLDNISKEEFFNLQWPTPPDENLREIKVNVY